MPVPPRVCGQLSRTDGAPQSLAAAVAIGFLKMRSHSLKTRLLVIIPLASGAGSEDQLAHAGKTPQPILLALARTAPVNGFRAAFRRWSRPCRRGMEAAIILSPCDTGVPKIGSCT